MQVIETRDAPTAAGHYSQAIVHNGVVYVAGQLPIDPKDKNIVSERTALSFGAPAGPLRATGGLDYNIAEGHLGNADVTLTYVRPRFALSGGARRYSSSSPEMSMVGATQPYRSA